MDSRDEPTPVTDGERPFPIQASHGRQPGFTVPWWLAELAYRDYSRRYGKQQSLARLAERGGFGREELIDHLIPVLLADRARAQERIEALEEHNVKLRDTLSEYMLTTAKPAEGFKSEEDYVGWQRSMNHWEREARALLKEVPDARA